MMYRLSGMLLALSLGLICWVAYEMGLLSHGRLEAAEMNEPAAFEALQRNLEEKMKSVEAREAALINRERLVQEKEKAVLEQVNSYEKRMHDLKAQAPVAVHQNAEKEKDANRLSIGAVYEKMEPKKSARILEQLDLVMASQILATMKKDRAAEVLGLMSQGRAKLVTEKFFLKRSLATGGASSGLVNEVTGPLPQK